MRKVKHLARHILARFQQCRFCGYRGMFPDSGECPSCGETN